MKINRFTAAVLSAVLSMTLADKVIVTRGACIDSNLPAQSSEVSNYHCEANPYYCAVGEDWWDPLKTAEEGLRCHFSSVAGYDYLDEKHIESTRTVELTTKIREDLSLPEVGRAVAGAIPGIVNLSNAYENSLPSAELTKKSLRTQPAFPKAVQHNLRVTPPIQDDKTLPWRGACIDSDKSAQSKVSNYHCEASPHYCDAGEEWWDLTRTAKGGLYCNHIMTSYNKLNKETHKLPRKRMLQVECSDNDYNILIELYNSMNGINWKKKDGWANNRFCGTWHGVVSDGTRVTKINLVNNNVTGLIPSNLGNLAALTELKLSRNKIYGPIPQEVGNLASLQILYLNVNELSGELPSHLGQLNNLKKMFLGINRLTGQIPCEIWNLGLTQLFLNNNRFTGDIIPSNCVQSRRRLQPNTEYQTFIQVYLNSNQLSGTIPDEFGEFSNMLHLDLEDNIYLTGRIPSKMCTLMRTTPYKVTYGRNVRC